MGVVLSIALSLHHPVPIFKKAEVSTGDYKNFITSLKAKIRLAQIKGAIAVNKELIKLYWDIGKDIVEKQDQEGWGSKVLEHGWSRSMLTVWIENDLYNREGKAITNFKSSLPTPQSDLAKQSLKDPYIFDFLELNKEHLEKEIEDGLVGHIQKFLIELGHGFAFVGQQYPIKAGKKDLYIDLLFYHLKLRCYVVIELKVESLIVEMQDK